MSGRGPGVIWWARHGSAEMEPPGMVLGRFGGSVREVLRLSVWEGSWGDLVGSFWKWAN